jgi:hypothetical protein
VFIHNVPSDFIRNRSGKKDKDKRQQESNIQKKQSAHRPGDNDIQVWTPVQSPLAFDLENVANRRPPISSNFSHLKLPRSPDRGVFRT